MVAWAAGVAAPVLLACCQWDPHGLARRLPSRKAVAYHCVLLLPWQVQCPGRVGAALAAGPGGLGTVPVLASPLGLLPGPASLAVCVAPCTAGVSLPFACRYAFPCSLCVPWARSGFPSGPHRVSVGCVCARAPAVYAPPPLRVGVARALRAVPVQNAGRAVPGGSCPPRFLPRSRASPI